ncbi:MAG: hypothetical protein ACKVQA_00285 [Burkholderiales bacterium]
MRDLSRDTEAAEVALSLPEDHTAGARPPPGARLPQAAGLEARRAAGALASQAHARRQRALGILGLLARLTRAPNSFTA